MEEQNADRSKSEGSSNKRLVRILVIVGIGIPVLVELLTLFNLINVQLFEDEKQDVRERESDVAVQELTEGDTLFADYAYPVVVDSMRMKVSARQWRFKLVFRLADTLSQHKPDIRIDSLQLNSGKILQGKDSYSWNTEGHAPLMVARWSVPSGDIPKWLFISSMQAVAEDSMRHITKEEKLGNIPVRYSRSVN